MDLERHGAAVEHGERSRQDAPDAPRGGQAGLARASAYSGRPSAPRIAESAVRRPDRMGCGLSTSRQTLLPLPAMGPGATLRVGVADAVDPRDPRAGSGASASLMAALDDLVAEAVPISGALEPRIATAARLASSATRLRPSDLRDPRAGVRRTHAAAQLGRPTIAARWLTMQVMPK